MAQFTRPALNLIIYTIDIYMAQEGGHSTIQYYIPGLNLPTAINQAGSMQVRAAS
jgi:hypothetical protein